MATRKALMFIRTKLSGGYTYLQIVENQWRNGAVRQRMIASLGRLVSNDNYYGQHHAAS